MVKLLTVLTLEQAREAYRCGLARSAAGRARNGQHRYGWNPPPDQQRDTDGESAVAELLVSVALGMPWTSNGVVPDADGTDVGGSVSVRWTPRTSGSLIVHEDERDDIGAALVVGRSPNQQFMGTILVKDAKRPEWWRTDVRYPAYFVPQTALEPPRGKR